MPKRGNKRGIGIFPFIGWLLAIAFVAWLVLLYVDKVDATRKTAALKGMDEFEAYELLTVILRKPVGGSDAENVAEMVISSYLENNYGGLERELTGYMKEYGCSEWIFWVRKDNNDIILFGESVGKVTGAKNEVVASQMLPLPSDEDIEVELHVLGRK